MRYLISFLASIGILIAISGLFGNVGLIFIGLVIFLLAFIADRGSGKQSTGAIAFAGSDASGKTPSDPERKACPHCAELILPQARVCRFCARELQEGWAD